MENALVTVVIPTYHRSDRIVRAVESALQQTCKTEVIVVDDNGNGTDEQNDTKKALDSYICKEKVVYLCNEKNSGGSFSRNRGLFIAKGAFITFLDDDDEIAPSKLEKQSDALINAGKKYSCCFCGYHKILSNGKVYINGEDIKGYVYPYALARSIYNGSGSNLLIRTDIAKAIGGYDDSFKRNQDLEFMARLLKNYKMAFVPDDLFTIHYEIRETKQTYQDLTAIDSFYMSKFKNEIESLPLKQRNAVYQTIALERFRYSIRYHKISDAIKNLKKEKVSFATFIRYLCYVANRIIFKKSYGFKLLKRVDI